MRAALAFTLVPLALAAAGPATAADQTVRRCYLNDPLLAAADPQGARLRRLDELPPAAEILTVLRSVHGCRRPVVARYGIGGNPAAAPVPAAAGW